jgi:hypothetical protein
MDTCVCGHIADEHDPRTQTCDIDQCPCGCFELDDDSEEND